MPLLNNDSILSMHPVDIYTAINSEYAHEDWLDWETDTLVQTVGVELKTEALDKLMAVQALGACSKLAVSDAVAFENVINAFCNNGCVMDCLQPPSIEEVFYGVRQMLKIITAVHSITEAEVPFTGEVPGYVGALAKYHDWVVLPTPLAFAKDTLTALTHMEPGTTKWAENSSLIRAGEAAIAHLGLDDSPDFGNLDDLLGESFSAMFIGRLVGAYLYDPTAQK